jgi:hypothetical protein
MALHGSPQVPGAGGDRRLGKRPLDGATKGVGVVADDPLGRAGELAKERLDGRRVLTGKGADVPEATAISPGA